MKNNAVKSRERELAALERQLSTHRAILPHKRREAIAQRIRTLTKRRDRLLRRERKRLESRLYQIADTLGEGIPW